MTNGLLLGMHSSRGGREEHTATGALIHHLVYAVRYLASVARASPFFIEREPCDWLAGPALPDGGPLTRPVSYYCMTTVQGRSRPVRRGLHRELVDTLGRRIVRGGLVPGDSLPNESDLGGELNVSRTVIREAIKVLASKGLVDSHPKTGTRVLPRAHWSLLDPDVLHWQFEDGANEGLLRELSEVRMIVEPAAAALAARRRTEADLRDIEGLLQTMWRLADDAEAYIGADLEFHSAILRATHNELLAQMAGTVHEALIASRQVTVRVPGGPSKAAPQHADVVKAIKAGDRAAASSAMERLVQGTWHDVETIFHSDGGPIDR